MDCFAVLAMTAVTSRRDSRLFHWCEVAFEDLLRRFGHVDGLPVAHIGENGALAVARHAADERNIDVDGPPRLEGRALNPEAHCNLLRSPAARIEAGRVARYADARNSRAAVTMLASAGRTSSHFRVFN